MFSFDPISALLASSALWIAYLAYRASCRIWIRIVKVEGAFSSSVYEPAHHHLDVVVQNLGLPLHQVEVALSFTDRDGAAYVLRMRRVAYRDRHKTISDNGEFAQGMIGAFRLKSTDLEKDNGYGVRMLSKLESPKKCDAKIQVFSQDFLVAEFRLWERFYKVKSKWNRFAHRVNSKFDKNIITSDGTTVLKTGNVLPKFNTDGQWRLECFVRGTARVTSHNRENLEGIKQLP